MKNIESFLNSKETYNKVLEILSVHGDFKAVETSTPYIAGGSVANTLISLIHGGQPVINDIDVYNKVDELPNNVFSEEKMVFSTENLNLFEDGYGRTYISTNGAKVSVVSHRRDGIFNIVDYNFIQSEIENYPLQIILDGFDLNCCMAGIDFGTEKIVYNQHFVNFLKTKQLKVISPNTPLQTSIRLFKKIEDLGCFCDVEHEMRFLTTTKMWIKNSREISSFIGPETIVKYEKYKDKVSKYFVLRELDVEEINRLEGHKPKSGFDFHQFRPKLEIMAFDPVKPFKTVEQVTTINEMKRIWYLLYTSKTKSEQNKINKIFYKNIFTGNDKEDNWFMTTAAGPNSMAYDCGYVSNRFTYLMIIAKKDYHKCAFDLKHVVTVDKFTNEHFGIRRLLSRIDTIAEQYQVIKNIKSVVNKEGDWIIGTLENYNWSNYFAGRSNRTLTKEEIKDIIEKTKIDDSKALIEKVDLTGFEHNGCVTELNTTLELKKEGYKMGHCVGGYSSALSGRFSRIFHIDCDGIGSTVEVSLPKTKHYFKYQEDGNEKWDLKNIKTAYQSFNAKKCFIVSEDGQEETINKRDLIFSNKQHFGRYPEKGNKIPTDTNKMIVTKLIQFLNQNYLPENYDISVENLESKEESDIFVH